MLTFRQYLDSLPAITGTDNNGNPIEDIGGGNTLRGHFFTFAQAATESSRIDAMLPEGVASSDPEPAPNNNGYKLTGDSAKLKQYNKTIDGHQYDLGSLLGLVSTFPGTSVGYYGMPGKLTPSAATDASGIYLTFTPDPSVPKPDLPHADVPPFAAPAGQEWVKGMMGWALVPKNASGYSESQINDILARVAKALRG